MDAEDLAQDTFIALIRGPTDVRGLREPRRELLRRLGIVAVVMPLGAMTWQLKPWRQWQAQYVTATGEQDDVALADGGAIAALPVTAEPRKEGGQHSALKPAKTFDIPAGPLSRVLSQFAGAAGVAISFNAAEFNHLASPGLQGRYSVEQGFAALLASTGKTAMDRGNGDYQLSQLDADTMVLPSVRVLSSELSTVTEGQRRLYATHCFHGHAQFRSKIYKEGTSNGIDYRSEQSAISLLAGQGRVKPLGLAKHPTAVPVGCFARQAGPRYP